MGNTGYMRSSGLPLCEPNQACEACGAFGTVGRAMRTDQNGYATETHRFCATCWAEHSARYKARWQEEDRIARDTWFRDPSHSAAPSRGTAFDSATWHSTLELVEHVNRELRPSPPPTAELLAKIAAEIEQSAAALVGEMPFEIAMFLQQHRSPES